MPSYLQFFVERGFPVSIMALLLVLPIVVTVIASIRQFVGFRAFGIYSALLLAYAFTITTLPFGLLIFATIALLGLGVGLFTRRYRVHYLARMALMLTLVSLALFLLFAIWTSLDLVLPTTVLAILPIVILVSFSEKITSVLIEQGFKTASYLTLETGLIATISYFIISWPALQTFLVHYPFVTLIAIPVNMLFGRWTGLRLIEYIRFREVLKRM